MKPRIVILSAFFSPFRSGAEACVEEIPPLLRDRFDFAIVTARLRRDLPKREFFSGDIPVVRVGIGAPIDKWLFPLLAPFAAKRFQPQIIHAVLESFAGAALILCRFLTPSARRVLTCQSTNTSLLVGAMHKSAHRVTVISTVLVERAHRLGRTDVIHIPNGIDVRAIVSACEKTQRVAQRILFVGRLEPMKGIDTLLRAFALLSQPARLRIVGDGSLRGSLEALAQELNVEGRVTFVGRVPVPDVFSEFAAAEVFAGLSRSEALGNVFIEAQAAGCVVVGTRVGGIPDVVKDNESGLLVPPDDPLAAADALSRVLGDAALRQRLTEHAIASSKMYDWPLIARQYANVYEDVLPTLGRA